MRWKQAQATWNEYREIVGISRNETNKAKDHLGIKSGQGCKDNKKCF